MTTWETAMMRIFAHSGIGAAFHPAAVRDGSGDLQRLVLCSAAQTTKGQRRCRRLCQSSKADRRACREEAQETQKGWEFGLLLRFLCLFAADPFTSSGSDSILVQACLDSSTKQPRLKRSMRPLVVETVRMVLRYVVFERVARFPRRLGSGYPQHVTKLAEKGLAVSAFGSAGRGPPGDERFGTLRGHGRQDIGRACLAASHPLPIPTNAWCLTPAEITCTWQTTPP